MARNEVDVSDRDIEEAPAISQAHERLAGSAIFTRLVAVERCRESTPDSQRVPVAACRLTFVGLWWKSVTVCQCARSFFNAITASLESRGWCAIPIAAPIGQVALDSFVQPLSPS